MLKAKARRISGAPLVDLSHCDLGLCYVSRMTIGMQTVYGIVRQDPMDEHKDIAFVRMEADRKALRDAGFQLDEESF